MEHYTVVEKWNASGLEIPSIFYLSCLGKNYAVVEDNTSIIIVISKARVVYAIASSKVKIVEIDGMGVPCYYVENPNSLKVISCTESTISEPNQYFVLKNIVPLI